MAARAGTQNPFPERGTTLLADDEKNDHRKHCTGNC
jgi:hypothetical protein